LTDQLGELSKFEVGTVGSKKPDLVEAFPQEGRAVVTDITQDPTNPVHNFKTRFYMEVIKAMTGWSDVGGLEFKSFEDQKIIE
jgi:hypothetical protein